MDVNLRIGVRQARKMPLLTELENICCSGSTKPPPPRDGGLIMEETRLTTDEFGVFWSFRNMLEMNNI